LARDTAGSKSSKHVDEEHNSINDQRSRDANEEDVKKKPTSAVDGFAQEIVDTAFKLGSPGHVKNVIAMFSSEEKNNAHKNRTDEQSGVIATKENATDDFEIHGSRIDEISENEDYLW
jgi:hypothetical protein